MDVTETVIPILEGFNEGSVSLLTERLRAGAKSIEDQRFNEGSVSLLTERVRVSFVWGD